MAGTGGWEQSPPKIGCYRRAVTPLWRGGPVLFQHTEGNKNYLEQVDADGTHRSEGRPVSDSGIPERFTWAAMGDRIRSRDTRKQNFRCHSDSAGRRSDAADFRKLLLSKMVDRRKIPFRSSGGFITGKPGLQFGDSPGAGENLPVLPADGISPFAESKVVRGAISVSREELVPGKDPEHYAWVNTTVHRNLYLSNLTALAREPTVRGHPQQLLRE